MRENRQSGLAGGGTDSQSVLPTPIFLPALRAYNRWLLAFEEDFVEFVAEGFAGGDGFSEVAFAEDIEERRFFGADGGVAGLAF